MLFLQKYKVLHFQRMLKHAVIISRHLDNASLTYKYALEQELRKTPLLYHAMILNYYS